MSLRRGSALLLIALAACSQDLSRGSLSPTGPTRSSVAYLAPGVTTVMEDGTPADIGAVAADIVSVAGRMSSVEAVPVDPAMSSLASDGTVRLLIVYPYGGNDGVPPLATLAANGITGTYHTGPVLNAAVLANYDVVFVGRSAVIPFLRPAPLSINTADVVAWISNGGTIVGETNSVGFDSDAWDGGNTFSSTMRSIFGIATLNGGGDCGTNSLPTSVNTLHPLAAGLPSSFTVTYGPSGGFVAWQCGSGLNPAANPTVVQWGIAGTQPLTTSKYGAGCTVWLPAVGFGNLNWAAQPNATKMYVNALRGCGASSLPSDDTPPVISPSVSGTLGTNGWYTSAVNVSWTVTDEESDVGATSGCDAVTLSTDTRVTLTCTATSDGGTASESVTIKIDQTAPIVTITGNAGSYTVDQMVDISCAYSDNLSGMVDYSCTGAYGPAWSIGVGTHAVSASGTDEAGNTSTASGSFTVSVTAGSLCSLVKAWVTQHGVANSMCQQLANGAYGAFQNHVRAQSGKSVAADKAAILRALVDELLGS